MLLEFFFSTPVATSLNLVIAAITLASLFQVMRAFSSQVQGTQRDLDLVQAADGGDSTALITSVSGAAPQGLVGRRLEALARFKAHGEPVDAEMLAAISAETARDAAPLARWAGTALVLLGLAGTLIGLSLAVGELSGLLAPGEVVGIQEISQAILGTLAQMKVAFSTTLAGVGGAVAVSSAMAYLRHRQSGVIRRLEEVSTTEWVPAFQTTEESRIGDAVKELEETRISLDGGLRGILESVDNGFGELSEQFRTRSTALLKEVEAMRDATLTIIGERDEDSLSLAQYVDTVKQTTDGLQEAVEASGQMLPQIQEALEETIRSEQRALAETLAEHTQAVRPLLEEQYTAAQALADAVGGEVKRMEQLEGVLERLTGSFESARGTWEKADESIEKMGRETRTALEEGLRNSLDAVSRLTEEQARSQERVTSALDGFQKTYKDTLEILTDQSRRALNQSQEMVEEVRATLQESLSLVGDRLIQAQQGQGVKIESGLNALGRELRDLSTTPARGSRHPRSHVSAGRHSSPSDEGNGRPISDVQGPSEESTTSKITPPELTPEEIQEDLRGLEE